MMGVLRFVCLAGVVGNYRKKSRLKAVILRCELKLKRMDKEKEKDEVLEPAPVSSRERYTQRYRERFPDMNMEDEEAFYSQANTDLDELDSYKKHSESLVGAFNNNRAFAAMMMAAKDGQDPFAWLAENMGADISEMLNDPEYLSKITEAAKKYNESQLKSEESRKESESNLAASLQTLKKIAEEKGMSDDQCLEVFSYIYDEILGNGMKGIVTDETFRMIIDGKNYAEDVASARQAGEVAGRNAKITEQLRKENTDKGVPPSLGGTAVPQKEAPKKKKYNRFLMD